MIIDVLQFVAMADKSLGLPFSRQTNSLGNACDIVTPIDPVSGYGQWQHVKNIQGWPWDIKLYDATHIYDWVTEGANGWSPDPNIGPKSYKKFIKNHVDKTGQLADGMIEFNRFIDTHTNHFNIIIPASQTQYATFEKCAQTAVTSLGVVTQRLHGPFLIDHGGNVGPQPTIIQQYYWSNNGVSTLEENYYALHYGWVAWKLQTLNTATQLYETVKTTVANVLAPATPKIVFPCF
jgi:hypothetical protein